MVEGSLNDAIGVSGSPLTCAKCGRMAVWMKMNIDGTDYWYIDLPCIECGSNVFDVQGE